MDDKISRNYGCRHDLAKLILESLREGGLLSGLPTTIFDDVYKEIHLTKGATGLSETSCERLESWPCFWWFFMK